MADATQRVIDLYGGSLELVPGGVQVRDQTKLRTPATDRLVWQAVFGTGDEREAARWLLWELGQVTGARPASIHELYMARGRGECGGFTVPAMNVRMLAYDTARAIFRAARAGKAGAIILEIARSEIAYTEQRPAEYVAVMIGAALREGYTLPLFIQGDHCQVNQKKYQANPAGEVGEVKKLIAEEVGAGFYNIDVDTSTLVDLSQPTLEEQQRLNYEHAAEITAFIRQQEPDGVAVSVGAEIGEVGM
ncbi:MAG TPA: class II fructose-bisphosphate aldolase, partial [Gemmatimonadales bacterium]|nr:class II fructose-bisphosphate aldolase [Gemmatimonadales bacterium]